MWGRTCLPGNQGQTCHSAAKWSRVTAVWTVGRGSWINNQQSMIKHRKSCESCPIQVTWKFKFKCQWNSVTAIWTVRRKRSALSNQRSICASYSGEKEVLKRWVDKKEQVHIRTSAAWNICVGESWPEVTAQLKSHKQQQKFHTCQRFDFLFQRMLRECWYDTVSDDVEM